MALQFISETAPPKQAEESQLLVFGKKYFFKRTKKKKSIGILECWVGGRGRALYQWRVH